MVITRAHANKLVREGKAILDGSTRIGGLRYQNVIRKDIHRTDHYRLYSGQPTKVAVHVENSSR